MQTTSSASPMRSATARSSRPPKRRSERCDEPLDSRCRGRGAGRRSLAHSRSARHAAECALVADRSTAADAPEQPGRRGRRAARGSRRLRRLRPRRAFARGAESDRADAPSSRRRRDAARPERQAGGRLPHARGRAARPDRKLASGPALGDVGRVPAARGRGADDVRADDRRKLDLHRHPGHPPGDLPDLCGRRRDSFRLRRSARPNDPDRGTGRDGGSPAARGDDGRRCDSVHRGRPVADRPEARDAVSRRGRGLAPGWRRSRSRCGG